MQKGMSAFTPIATAKANSRKKSCLLYSESDLHGSLVPLTRESSPVIIELPDCFLICLNGPQMAAKLLPR